MDIDFKKHYEVLRIDAPVDWGTLQREYRRLINQWHPDRPHNLGIDSEESQQRFIELTKSYTALRDFHRKHKRLPHFSHGYTYIEPGLTEPVEFDETESHWNAARAEQVDAQNTTGKHWIKYGIFGVASTLFVGSLAGLFYLDMKVRAKASEAAKVEVYSAKPSRFEYAPEKIKRSQARSTYIASDPMNTPFSNQTKSGILSE